MTIAVVRERVQTFRQTKLYDLFAAAPLIAWYGFCAAQMLPLVAQQIELIKLFVQTDPSVLPAELVLSTVAHVATLAFLAILVVMFAVRHVPQRTAPGFYPRCAAVAGTFLSVGMVQLPLQELSYALYLASLLLIIGGTGLAIYAALVLGRSISILPEARRLVTCGPYALVRHPLYLGEIVALAGVAMQYLSAWALLLLALVCAFQLQRMKYEEGVLFQAFLKYGDYMARTARLMPGVY
jgi:protein-S-isoprenylcysteine O-methyltransferase Ste14